MIAQDMMMLVWNNNNISNSIAKIHNILCLYQSPACSISGGADSDIMLDMVHKLDEEKKVRYVWFNTGLEYEATRRHLEELESKYRIRLERVRAEKSIAESCREFGQPFLSKFVSARISQLQHIGFDFSDMSYDDMRHNFPFAKNVADWWHNRCVVDNFNINRYRHLKRFLMTYPPKFRISDKCCEYAKKRPGKKYAIENDIDVQMVGVRKAEGGIRSMLKSCVTGTGINTIFRPLYWFTDRDKEFYCELFGVIHSDCYTRYGLKRTGCAGCPFNPNLFDEIDQVQDSEAPLLTAAQHIFSDSYSYTKLYRDFVRDVTL